jgi:hypothetical protein
MTYSMVARDPVTGALGATTATGMMAVGANVPHCYSKAPIPDLQALYLHSCEPDYSEFVKRLPTRGAPGRG